MSFIWSILEDMIFYHSYFMLIYDLTIITTFSFDKRY